MTIKEAISKDLVEAMRAKEKEIVAALRLISAAIKQIEVDERIQVDDTRALVILDKLSKQRQDSMNQFASAGRQDLVEKEQFELNLIKKYLPEPLSEDELKLFLDDAINVTEASSATDMGKVMAYLKPKIQGRADMRIVSAMVKERLN